MPEPGEDEHQRIDRELIELLNELRVALPGVQVLFAFLLTVPFSQRFREVTTAQRAVYYGAFICATLATALLIAPSSYHRVQFRRRDKERMLLTSNKLAIAGMAFLAVSVAGVVFLISDVLYHLGIAAGMTAAITACFVWFWYGLPLMRPSPPDR
jgi:hypothetical protein